MNSKSKTIDRCQISKKKDLKRILSLGFLPPVNDYQPINSRKKEEIFVSTDESNPLPSAPPPEEY